MGKPTIKLRGCVGPGLRGTDCKAPEVGSGPSWKYRGLLQLEEKALPSWGGGTDGGMAGSGWAGPQGHRGRSNRLSLGARGGWRNLILWRVKCRRLKSTETNRDVKGNQRESCFFNHHSFWSVPNYLVGYTHIFSPPKQKSPSLRFPV